MPRYYVPPAPGTVPVRARRAAWWPLLLLAAGLLLAGLLTPPGRELLNVLAMCAIILLYVLFSWGLYLLGFWVLLYLISRVDRQVRRRNPPRPAPYWIWQTWEILLCLAALLLAVLCYAVADGSTWLRRGWRRRQAAKK